MSDPLDDLQPDDPIELYPGIVMRWLWPRRLISFHFATTDPDGFDVWAETLVAIINDWPRRRPILTLHDQTDPAFGFTPHLRERSKEVFRIYLDSGLSGREAGIVRRKTPTMRHLAEAYSRHPHFDMHLFTNYESGLRWLMKVLRP